MSQRERVLEYLQHHGSITSLEAFRGLGIISLSRRICDLRQQGHRIQVERVADRNRYGEKVIYNRYSLKEKAAQGATNTQDGTNAATGHETHHHGITASGTMQGGKHD